MKRLFQVGCTAILALPMLAAAQSAAEVFPKAGALNVPPDAPLKLTFKSPVTLGTGRIQIFDAASGKAVETFDVGVKTATKAIGGAANFQYYPVLAAGNEVALYPAGNLQYDKTYYVQVEAGALKEGSNPFAGISDPAQWRFTTRNEAPRLPAEAGRRITVAADGSGDFCTIQGAIDFLPANSSTPTTIFIKRGTYTELVYFASKHAITLLGEDRKQTVLQYATNANFNAARRGLLQADRCNDLVIGNMTLRNTTPQGGSQAEAIILKGSNSARAIVANVDLYSFQDTLQISGQTYLRNCYIEGDVDFMWGSGPCFFESCTAKTVRNNAYFTQIRNTTANHGYVYYKCTFEGAAGITGNVLSRIAPDRFPASEVVLIDCQLSSAVSDVAWKLDAAPAAPGRGPGTGAADVSAAAANVRFWEYNSHDAAGKPVDVSKRLSISRQLKMPEDEEIIRNYSNPAWVLGNNWTPKLPAELQEKGGR
jgi:pectin methylesterase-like acyl-CoA thioesterase